ncbi:MAG: HDIG domain-containing protein [Anaerolineae bacterium]|nr:HDIG domain-containing protein [Anaerolineae bacterium]MDQ7033404.1 HDIG domain-containing protein [Anaerolineae bacterium]
MAEQLSHLLEDRFRIPQERMLIIIRRTLIFIAATVFVLVASLFVAFDSLFVPFNRISTLQEDDISPRNIAAPNNTDYVSEVLTERVRQAARDSVAPVFDPPDPNIAGQQNQVAQQILDYIENVRADTYGTREQRIHDLTAINVLSLDEDTLQTILQLEDETWSRVEDEILSVLSRMMRFEIRLGGEQNIRIQLDNQVNARFSLRERDVIVDIVSDLILPNTFQNIEETEAARAAAAAAVEPQPRTFTTGQVIVREGEKVDDLMYEALLYMNLISSDESVFPDIVRAGVSSIITMVITGLYMARFTHNLLYNETRKLALIAAIFLMTLGSARFMGIEDNIYLFPAAAMALLYVAIASPHIAIIGSIGLALLIGMMDNDSLQYATLISTSGIIGTLVLRRAERLNQFFLAGALVAVNNVLVVIIFNIATPPNEQFALLQSIGQAAFGGLVVVPATAIAALYIVTLIFNLPTTLKLIDLNQPSKPLLQRLLREAPGSYQHSLQVANLAEQAANAIGADAQLTHVAAMYHDIGKMLNPLYFTENQQDITNPHDALNDPYRSADIIIGHVTEGDELAKQYRLPQRIRDFIREHHGTTQVFVFYQRALNAVNGDESAVDIADFTYPGPRPRSKETAILMLADSCEAAVRSIKPQSKQDISDLVINIIEGKRASSQLDDADLTLNDIRTIRDIFVEVLQGMFHPRINYQEAIGSKPKTVPTPPKLKAIAPVAATNGTPAPKKQPEGSLSKTKPSEAVPLFTVPAETKAPIAEVNKVSEPQIYDEEEPMTEVPRLPTLEARRTSNGQNAGNTADHSEKEKAQKKDESDT